MKTTLLASTALVLSVGAAAAAGFEMADTGHDHSITLSGDARMGVIHHALTATSTTTSTSTFVVVTTGGLTTVTVTNTNTTTVTDYVTEFTSRARVKFTAAGETDGGLGFGFSFRVADAGDAGSGAAGSVFISQGGHTLAMGDVDSAAKAAVGNVSGVGLTGLGDYNEMSYQLNDNTPGLLYSYSGGALSFHLSLDNANLTADPATSEDIGDGAAIGIGYSAGSFSVALGHESDNDGTDSTYLGVGADVGSIALHAIAADHGAAGDEWAVSADLTTGATTFTVFAADNNGSGSAGLGVAHDLGGGASIKAGVVDSDAETEAIWDMGLAFTF